MTRSVPLARHNLVRHRLRFVLSVVGVGLSLLLVLSLDAVYSAILKEVTAYPDNAGAPVIVSQRGVETMHMSNSAMPSSVVGDLRRDNDVRRAVPILYTTMVLGSRRQDYSYLIGFRGRGGPWRMAAGRSRPRGDEIVIDERTADKLGLKVGSRVHVAGARLRIVGLAEGTASVMNSVSFVSFRTFERIFDAYGTVSYVLVWPRRDISPERLAATLDRDHTGFTAQTKEEFSEHERHVVSDMSTSLIWGLVIIGFVVGVIVAGLSIYTATTARLREYAVLKAIGMRNLRLLLVISSQALMTVGAGLALSVVMLLALSEVVPRIVPSVSMVITLSALAKSVVITAIIGVVAALLPAYRVAVVEPATVYRHE